MLIRIKELDKADAYYRYRYLFEGEVFAEVPGWGTVIRFMNEDAYRELTFAFNDIQLGPAGAEYSVFMHPGSLIDIEEIII